MKTMTKKQAQEIIDKLTNFENFIFNCRACGSRDESRIEQSVMLGDVLEKVKSWIPDNLDEVLDLAVERIIKRWNQCGINKSLQDILEGAEEEFSHCMSNCPEPWCASCVGILKSPVAELFIYLDSIFNQ